MGKILLIAALMSVSAFAQIAAPKDSRGVAIAKEVKFEVLSIRPMAETPTAFTTGPTPSGFTSRLSAWQMITIAYGPSDPALWVSMQLLNTPTWAGTDFYEINGRVSEADAKAWQNQSSEHELLRSAMRAALKDRFHLVIHEQRDAAFIYELVVDKRGPRLNAAAPEATLPVGVKTPGGGVMVGKTMADRKALWECHAVSMQDLAWYLSRVSVPALVRDKTGLTGRYDFTLKEVDISPGENRVESYPIDHLGLKLRPGTENRPKLVVDHIEKPTAN